MANKRNGTLYVGVTSDLVKRVWQHKHPTSRSFTSKYSVKLLVYYEVTADIYQAIVREKQIKAWKRSWKLKLIEAKNPFWRDLYDEIAGFQPSLE